MNWWRLDSWFMGKDRFHKNKPRMDGCTDNNLKRWTCNWRMKWELLHGLQHEVKQVPENILYLLYKIKPSWRNRVKADQRMLALLKSAEVTERPAHRSFCCSEQNILYHQSCFFFKSYLSSNHFTWSLSTEVWGVLWSWFSVNTWCRQNKTSETNKSIWPVSEWFILFSQAIWSNYQKDVVYF